MEEVYRNSTPRTHGVSSGHRLTHGSPNKHSASARVHIQSGIESIGKTPALYSKVFQFFQMNPLMTFAAIKEYSCLRYSCRGSLLRVKGKVEGFIQGSSTNWHFSTGGTPRPPGPNILSTEGPPKPVNLWQKTNTLIPKPIIVTVMASICSNNLIPKQTVQM
eukprot:3826453-Amphidinium_carterae.1